MQEKEAVRGISDRDHEWWSALAQAFPEFGQWTCEASADTMPQDIVQTFKRWHESLFELRDDLQRCGVCRKVCRYEDMVHGYEDGPFCQECTTPTPEASHE